MVNTPKYIQYLTRTVISSVRKKLTVLCKRSCRKRPDTAGERLKQSARWKRF